MHMVFLFDVQTSMLAISLVAFCAAMLDYRLAILHSGECLWLRPALSHFCWGLLLSLCDVCSCLTDPLSRFYPFGYDNVGFCHCARTDCEQDWMPLIPGLSRTFQLPPVFRQVQPQIRLVADNTFADDVALVQFDACVNAFMNEETGMTAALSWLWVVLR